LKRILPFLVIVLVYFGYAYYDDYKIVNKLKKDKKYAEVTALVWVASAKYRHEPERFIEYRDSVMTSFSLDISKAHEYIESYTKTPEELGDFANFVTFYVDSFVKIEDSLYKANIDTTKDSLDTQTKIQIK
jgi:hypothetical protein